MTDVANRNRVTKGVTNGGQFAAESKAEQTGGTSFLKPAETGPKLDDAKNRAIVDVVNGPLSRGVANKDRRTAFDLMYLDNAPGHLDFAGGMMDTVHTLYGHRLDEVAREPGGEPHELKVAGKKRTRAEDRARWATTMGTVPDWVKAKGPGAIAEFNRGRIAGALVLSGLDHEYDLSRPEPSSDEDAAESSPDNVVTTAEFDGREFEIDLNDDELDNYTIYEGNEELASFVYTGDPEDHDVLQSAALNELSSTGDIERCSECEGSLADGEGYDGLCGNCADRAEKDDDDDEDDGPSALALTPAAAPGMSILVAQRREDGTYVYAGKTVVPGQKLRVFHRGGSTEYLVQGPAGDAS
ncbi:hypothetical protein LG293_17110 (plasmid) [Citricoccus nitrophenolicus]